MANLFASEILLDAFAFLPRVAIEQRVKRVNHKFLYCAKAMRRQPFLWYSEFTVALSTVPPLTIEISMEDYSISPRKIALKFSGNLLKTLQIPAYLKVNNVTLRLPREAFNLPYDDDDVGPSDVFRLLEQMKNAWCRKSSPDHRKCNRMTIIVDEVSALERVAPLISAYIVHIRLFTLKSWPLADFFRIDGVRYCMQMTIEANVCDFSCVPVAQLVEWLCQPLRLCAADYGRTLRLITLNGRMSTPYYAKYEHLARLLVEAFNAADEPATYTVSIQAPVYVSNMSSHVTKIHHKNSKTREILAGKLLPNQISLKRYAVENE